MTAAEFVALLSQIFDFLVNILYQLGDFFNGNILLQGILALFVLKKVIDLFKYIIKS